MILKGFCLRNGSRVFIVSKSWTMQTCLGFPGRISSLRKVYVAMRVFSIRFGVSFCLHNILFRFCEACFLKRA